MKKLMQLWSAFYREIVYYYSNNDHIYNTPNIKADYERISANLMILTMQMSRVNLNYEDDEYDEAEIKRAVNAILDQVGQTMRNTADRVGDTTTIVVLDAVQQWANT